MKKATILWESSSAMVSPDKNMTGIEYTKVSFLSYSVIDNLRYFNSHHHHCHHLFALSKIYKKFTTLFFLARRPQETTGLMGQATSQLTVFTNGCYACAARLIQD